MLLLAVLTEAAKLMQIYDYYKLGILQKGYLTHSLT